MPPTHIIAQTLDMPINKDSTNLSIDIVSYQMTKLIVVSMGICMFAFSTFRAQSIDERKDKIATLKQKYLAATTDSARLHFYTVMSRDYRYVDSDSAKYHLSCSFKMHDKLKANEPIYVFAFDVIDDIHRKDNSIDSAIYYYEKALEVFKDSESPYPFLAICTPYSNTLVKDNQVDLKNPKEVLAAVAVA